MNFDSQLITTTFYAFLGGLIPAIIWLFFWKTEDKEKPEPKSMLALAFIGGMVAVFISLFLEKYFYKIGLTNIFENNFLLEKILPFFESASKQNVLSLDKTLLVLIFAPIIEEISKFVMAYILVLRSKANDEPLDPMIYMITVALGFSAIENMLFLINPLQSGNFLLSFFTGNMRFIGATLLHTISSAIIGLFISFNYYGTRLKKTIYIFLGILSAIFMHSVFNYLMIGDQKSSTIALELIWIIVIIILLAFEKIKQIKMSRIS